MNTGAGPGAHRPRAPVRGQIQYGSFALEEPSAAEQERRQRLADS